MKLPQGCMGVPPQMVKRPCGIGVDVRYDSYDVAIGYVERPAIDRFVTKLVFYGKVPDEEAVKFLRRQYGCVVGVGDARPDATVMARLQAALRKDRVQFYRAQYNTAPSNVEMIVNAKEGLLTLERTMTLDNVFFAASTGLGLALPQNFRDIHKGEFVSELCASTRVPVLWHGEQWSRWTEGGAADHAFHTLNYLNIAIKIGKLHLARGGDLMAMRGAVESTIDENLDDEEDMPLWGPKGEGISLEA